MDTLNTLSLPFVEVLYAAFLRDPTAVDERWRAYFARLPADPRFATDPRLAPQQRVGSLFDPAADGNGRAVVRPSSPAATASGAPQREVSSAGDTAALHERVDQLIHAYRVRGHLAAAVDPLSMPRPRPPELELEFHGLSEADLDRAVSTEAMHGDDVRPLRDILERMRNTYCRSIGVQFMHIDSLVARRWLQARMEGVQNRLALTRDEQLRILTCLSDAVVFEDFIQKKFPGAKTFSLRGAESLIPLLDLAIEKAGEQGIEEIVLGMAHRGRLNVLANIMGKSPRQIFREFADLDSQLYLGRGDVKYHLGYNHHRTTSSGRRVNLSLCFNPSHLEYVNTVALGRMRAKQDRASDAARERGLVLLIHGDAAFAGEGIVQETLNLGQLDGYTVGGTLHVIVNNNIGFTTSPHEARSSVYATDVAKMLQIPIFHVNGEDPEAVAQVVRLAMDFRRQFRRDVVIDMYCYRRYGHNESDEPGFTQPLMYRAISQRKSVREGYLDHLLAHHGVTREEADRIVEQRRERLEQDLSIARSSDYVHSVQALSGVWKGYHGGSERPQDDMPTGVSRAKLSELMARLTDLPADFKAHPRIERFLQARRDMAAGRRPLDWAAGEALAIASLAAEGRRVRLSGQDSERGTFSQRHAVLHDIETGRKHSPFWTLDANAGAVEIINSPLSEAGVLGFEYGYSLDCPDGLICWEAQFGDFVNCAQCIIDQFLVSAERKWYRLSGLVLLLPHGFEGQGPEHSSARLERFLALAAEENIQVAYPTTPAQYFHLLRRQVVRRWRKPLVVMTPKSLLRHPEAVSTLDECAAGRFARVIGDSGVDPGGVSRILACSGKVYYELREERSRLKRDDVAIVRIEQLYPLPADLLRAALSSFPPDVPVNWVQEEPENMGAWRFLRTHLDDAMLGGRALRLISRPAAASPATGSNASHKLEQARLLSDAFASTPPESRPARGVPAAAGMTSGG